jgi:hypothetical protein
MQSTVAEQERSTDLRLSEPRRTLQKSWVDVHGLTLLIKARCTLWELLWLRFLRRLRCAWR